LAHCANRWQALATPLLWPGGKAGYLRKYAAVCCLAPHAAVLGVGKDLLTLNLVPGGEVELVFNAKVRSAFGRLAPINLAHATSLRPSTILLRR
ncbi:hypothetical protein CN944_31245, partial [Bacillus thuringiensis]